MNTRLIPALLALASLSGCRFPAIAPQTPSELTHPGATQAAPALRGKVDFGMQAQAGVGELIEAATVSLIDAASGRTVSTARTDAQGQFVLNFETGFTADAAATYTLEAVKGLGNNQPGHPAVRLRTIVCYANGWTSITNTAPNAGIVLNAATTALSIGAGYLSGFDASLLVGKLAGTTYTPIGALSEAHYQAILELVGEILASDQDPVHRVGRSASGNWMILDQPLTVSSLGQIEVARGETITLNGTFQPELDAQSVTFGGVSAKVVAATTKTLRVQVPAIPWYATGSITVRRGQAEAPGPEYTNEPTVDVLAGVRSDRTTFIASGDGGPATSATFVTLAGVAVDASGSVYLADHGQHRIRKVAPDGIITTFAGGGSGGDGGLATSASLASPSGVAADAAGNIYIADTSNHTIRKVSPEGIITTVAGIRSLGGNGGDGGLAKSATLLAPQGVALGDTGKLYLASTHNYRVRVVGLDGIINAFAGKNSYTYTGAYGPYGDGGPAVEAILQEPRGLAVDRSGNVFIADDRGQVRRVNSAGVITTVAGGGNSFAEDIPATQAKLPRATGVALDAVGNLYVAYSTPDGVVVRQVGTDGRIRTVFQSGTQPQTAGNVQHRPSVALDPQGRLIITDTWNLQAIRLE